MYTIIFIYSSRLVLPNGRFTEWKIPFCCFYLFYVQRGVKYNIYIGVTYRLEIIGMCVYNNNNKQLVRTIKCQCETACPRLSTIACQIHIIITFKTNSRGGK